MILRWLRGLMRALRLLRREEEPVPDEFTENERLAMDEIRRHEGFWGLTPEGPKLNAPSEIGTSGYYDSEGYLTTGIGHRVPGVPQDKDRANTPVPGFDLSWKQTLEQYETDFSTHLEAAKKTPGYEKANDRQQRGLINLAFNMGDGWWAPNPMRESNPKGWPLFSKAAKKGDWEEASKELVDSKWFTQVGGRGPEVVSLIKPEILIAMVPPVDRVGKTRRQGVMGLLGRTK